MKIYVAGYLLKDYPHLRLGASLIKSENEWEASEKLHIDHKKKNLEIVDFILIDVTQKILEWFKWR